MLFYSSGFFCFVLNGTWLILPGLCGILLLNGISSLNCILFLFFSPEAFAVVNSKKNFSPRKEEVQRFVVVQISSVALQEK